MTPIKTAFILYMEVFYLRDIPPKKSPAIPIWLPLLGAVVHQNFLAHGAGWPFAQPLANY